MSERNIRIVVIGIGNCPLSPVQGVAYCRIASPDDSIPGLIYVAAGGYHIPDIEFAAAFAVDVNKVSNDMSEAIYAEPNWTIAFAAVPMLGWCRHRRHSLRQVGAAKQHLRLAAGSVGLLHEVATKPVPQRCGSRHGPLAHPRDFRQALHRRDGGRRGEKR